MLRALTRRDRVIIQRFNDSTGGRSVRLFPADHLLHQRFESGVAAQIIEQRIGLNDEKIVGVMRLIGALQFGKGAFFFSQPKKGQRDRKFRTRDGSHRPR